MCPKPDQAVPAPPSGRIPPESRAALLALARQTIEDALAAGGRRPDFAIEDWSAADRVGTDPVLTDTGAAFVTLRSASGDLLGCIGSLTARQPLVADVAEHAFDAAFRDPRFPAMTQERARGMVIDISVLSPSRPFPCGDYADLRARIPVGSGLVVSAGRHRATFLPAVWEQLPDPDDFLAALWRKAGLAPGEWPRGTQVEVYDSGGVRRGLTPPVPRRPRSPTGWDILRRWLNILRPARLSGSATARGSSATVSRPRLSLSSPARSTSSPVTGWLS